MVHRDAVTRAALCAVAISAAFFIGQGPLGGGQFSLFASFGGFALLVFADFPGDRPARAASYATLGIAGAALISLGSVCASPAWVAVVAMLVVGAGVLFAGVLSAALAGASRAALLTFILPVTIPGGPSDIPDRLGGWALALVLCVPTALFLFPKADHRRARGDAAALCHAIARLLDGLLGADPEAPVDGRLRAEVASKRDALRSQFTRDITRPVGLNAGSRALVRIVAELEWLASLVMRVEPADVGRWGPAIREATTTSVSVLDGCGTVLAAARPTPPEPLVCDKESEDRVSTSLSQTMSDGQLRELVERSTREGRVAFDVTVDSIVDGSRALPTFSPHEVATTTALVGQTVAWAAAADSRPLVERMLGTGLPTVDPGTRLLGEVPGLRSSAWSYVTGRSVWFRNSIRGGLGLAIAVCLAVTFDVQHGFWVVLGALSVLRSSALSTGTTALQAIIGTIVGFAVGASIILVVGTGEVALSIVLPLAVFIASYAPAMSFGAGQAAFTLVVLILFNLIEPVGWKVGVTRIEDVVLGCAISLLVGLLLWPRGASAAVDSALAAAQRDGAEYFRRATDVAVAGAAIPTDHAEAAVVSGRLLDDALRQFQVELGQNRSALAELIDAASTAARFRLAADAICSLGVESDATTGLLPATRQVLAEHATRVTAAATMTQQEPATNVAGATDLPDIGRTVAWELHEEIGPGVDAGDLPRRLLWAAMYIHDVERRSHPAPLR